MRGRGDDGKENEVGQVPKETGLDKFPFSSKSMIVFSECLRMSPRNRVCECVAKQRRLGGTDVVQIKLDAVTRIELMSIFRRGVVLEGVKWMVVARDVENGQPNRERCEVRDLGTPNDPEVLFPPFQHGCFSGGRS